MHHVPIAHVLLTEALGRNYLVLCRLYCCISVAVDCLAIPEAPIPKQQWSIVRKSNGEEGVNGVMHISFASFHRAF